MTLFADQDFYKTLLDNLLEGVYVVDRERCITYWNKGAEQLTGYSSEEVLGKYCAASILMHVDARGQRLCTSCACPAEAAMSQGVSLEQQVFLHHKDGHRLPVLTRVVPIRDASGTVVGAVEVFTDNSATLAVVEQVERLKLAALLDPLTGVGNRRFGEQELENKLKEMERYGWPLGVLFVDIDHFKQVNDTHGHDIGDKLLRMVAQTLAQGVRSFDKVVRWGGEEFIVLLTNVREENLMVQAERLRRLVEQSGLAYPDKEIEITVSVGATLAKVGDTPEIVVRRADKAMYSSKASGRNRITSLFPSVSARASE